jgi:N-acetyl-alpha-D-glucosaminyl L-malate synthase BshA
MNIGITCYPTYGGSGIVATELGLELATRGHEVHFVTYSNPIRLDPGTPRIHYHEVEVSTYPLFQYPPYCLALASRMMEVAESYDLDLFHVHYAIPHSISAMLAQQMLAPKRRLPFITTLHGTDITLVGADPSYFPITKFSIEQSDGVTSISEDLRRQTIEVFGIQNEIRVINNFINTDLYRPLVDPSLRTPYAPNGEKLLIHVSNFRPVKRTIDCIRILAEVLKHTPAHLLMVGDGPDRGPAEHLARELKVMQHVSFLGKQDHVERLIQLAHALLMPSEMESFGLVALEAMACGVVPVATRVGGVPEVIEHGVSGMMTTVGDVSAQAACVVSLLTDEALHQRMAEAGRQRARDRLKGRATSRPWKLASEPDNLEQTSHEEVYFRSHSLRKSQGVNMIRSGLACLILTSTIALAADVASTSYQVTFNKHVLPILQKNCQECHRPGEIGPMPFMTYESTRPWAKAIKAAVASKKMPPWFADAKYGHFLNERQLSDADIATLSKWADSGAPEGDAKDKPAPREFTTGWNIKPDLIFKMPKAYRVPAKGVIEYTYITVTAPFKEDTWVVAGEVRPGNRSVVHHVVANVRPKGSKWMTNAVLGGEPVAPGPTRDIDLIKANGGNPSVLDNEFLVGYVPGMEAQRFDIDRSAKLIPAGADIVLELHYTTNGKDADDQTMVGLELAKAPPQRRFMSIAAAQTNLNIAPGDANAEAVAHLKFGQPVDFVYMQPHMHLRGKDMKIEAKYPTGEKETLLNVPRYDFNWQIVYYEKTPLKFPKGTELELTAHWDNSPNNKWNPDPKATVHWGDQSFQEMLAAPMAVIVDRNVDPKSVVVMGAFNGGAQ